MPQGSKRSSPGLLQVATVKSQSRNQPCQLQDCQLNFLAQSWPNCTDFCTAKRENPIIPMK